MITITGSLAYDYIMKFDGVFSDHLITTNKNLSVSFFANSLDKHFGGTAGNIAYTLSLLGSRVNLVSTLGKDFSDYFEHFVKTDISTKYITIADDDITASAYILTDLKNNQITSFYGGAMLKAREMDVKFTHPDIVIIAPTQVDKMFQHVNSCLDNNISYIFDPGQSLPLWSLQDLRKSIQSSMITIVNEYECDLIKKKLNISDSELKSLTKTLIITLGDKGSVILDKDKEIKIPIARNTKIVDPTGCGDAYRAGLLYGLENNFNLEKSCKLGSLLASYVICENTTQSHNFSLTDIKESYQKYYQENF